MIAEGRTSQEFFARTVDYFLDPSDDAPMVVVTVIEALKKATKT
jgi:hypothetical protein